MPFLTPFFSSACVPWRSVALGGVLAGLLGACSTTPLPPWPNAPENAQGTPSASNPPDAIAPVRTVPPPPSKSTPIKPSHPPIARPGTGAAQVYPLGPVTVATPGGPAAYSPAVAALFPDPAQRYDTPGLAPERSSFTTNAELEQWLQRLQTTPGTPSTPGPTLTLQRIGASHNGIAIMALVATEAAAGDAATLETHNRPTVLLVGQQRGDAPASAEALLLLARELAPGGSLVSVLKDINVILVPRAHPDAAQAGQTQGPNGIDLPHDHLQLASPEAQALAQLVRSYRPSVVIGLHEYPAAGVFFQQFQALQRYDALVQYASAANTPEFITKAAREWFYEPLSSALQAQNLSIHLNYNPKADGQGLMTAGSEADSLENASSLKNAVSLLVRTRGADLGRTHIQRRVHTHVTAATSLLRSAATRAASLQQVRAFVVRETNSQACRGQTLVQAGLTATETDIALLEPQTGALRTQRMVLDSALALRPMTLRARPCGYWLAEDAQPAVEKLQQLGLQVLRVAEAGSVLAETDLPPKPLSPGLHAAAIVAPPGAARRAIDIPANSYYVPLNQPWAHLAIAALEPESPSSYLAQGLVPGLDSQARVMAAPALVFEDGD